MPAGSDTPQLFPTLQGLWEMYRNQGVLPMARELGEQLNRLAQRDADPAHLLEAHDTLGNTLFFLGEYVGARMHLEQGLALTDLGGVWGMLVYAWFSEGFDTADLQEASALLKTLM